MKIAAIQHPKYTKQLADWTKWRLAYEGGNQFINDYLETYSAREDPNDFVRRKNITYCPRFAGAAIDDIKNSIYQRMTEIHRNNGSDSYKSAIAGLNGGVDLEGSTMNTFIGQKVIADLLTMSKVGIYIDSPRISGLTLADNQGKRPYIYPYRAEDIKCWIKDDNDPQFMLSLILEETVVAYNEDGLPSTEFTRFRYIDKTESGIRIRFFDRENNQLDVENNPDSSAEYILNIPRIPFVVMELSDSLMRNIAQYQVALLNIESSDLNYLLKMNFPFYTEQRDLRAENPYVKPTEGEKVNEVKGSGRTYPLGAERPGFINPSSEPLKISMEKQAQIKSDMYALLNLSISNLQPKFASAESKQMDNRTLENGLSYIGLELERGENLIAEIWASYEKAAPAIVKYPEKYNLTSQGDKTQEIANNNILIDRIPSKTCRQLLMKRNAELALGSKIPNDTLDQINSEIDQVDYIGGEPASIQLDIEAGIVSVATASKVRGCKPEEVEQANKDRAERLKIIADNQAPKGVADQQINPANKAKEDKKFDKNGNKQKRRGNGAV